MCELVDIGTPEKEIKTPAFKQSKKLIDDVFKGVVSPISLSTELFDFTFFALSTIVAETFGLPTDFKTGSIRFRRAAQMKNNLSLFSGVKTFQNILELSGSVFDSNGQVIPLNEFNKIAKGINERYNLTWLSTEQQASFRQSESAETWLEVSEDKETFPFLRYSTVGDARVRKDHAEQNGVVKRVDDPFWNTWFPPNDWNCRCIVTQLEKATVTKGTLPENDNPVFGTNVGKNGLIFQKKHPYFDVPKEFNQAKRNNFGFKTPSDEQIKNLL